MLLQQNVLGEISKQLFRRGSPQEPKRVDVLVWFLEKTWEKIKMLTQPLCVWSNRLIELGSLPFILCSVPKWRSLFQYLICEKNSLSYRSCAQLCSAHLRRQPSCKGLLLGMDKYEHLNFRQFRNKQSIESASTSQLRGDGILLPESFFWFI